MYRCEFCRTVSRPGEPKKVHVVSRRVPERVFEIYDRRGSVVGIRRSPARTEVQQEFCVCLTCQAFLQAGGSIQNLRIDASRRMAAESGLTSPISTLKIAQVPQHEGGKSIVKRPKIVLPRAKKNNDDVLKEMKDPPVEIPMTSSRGPRKAIRKANRKTD